MTLTEDDKKRIAEEERYRAKIQAQEKKKREAEEATQLASGCLVLAIIGVIVYFTMCNGQSNEPQQSSPSLSIDLHAAVNRIDDNTISVTNRDQANWSKCTLKLNYEILSDGFTYDIGLIKAGETIRLNLDKFAKSDGTKFNFLIHSQKKINIFCLDVEGYSGNYFGKWGKD